RCRTRWLVSGPRGPVHELDDDAVGVGDLEEALSPFLDGQGHGDDDPLRAQPSQLAFEVVDGKGEDQACGVLVALVDAGPGAQLQGAQNAVADLMIGLPNGAEAAVVAARPARLVQPLTGDAGSVVQALAGATFSGPRDDASALTLAVREVLRGPPGRRAVVLITTTPIPAALASDVSGQLRAADASLYVAAVPEVAPSFARLASASGGWAVTASSARSLMPAVDAIGADLAHQYQLAYATTEPALTATRLRVAVAEGGTTATAEATVRVPASSGSSAPRAQLPAGAHGNAGVSVAWLIAAVQLLCLAGAAIVDIRRMWRKPGRS